MPLAEDERWLKETIQVYRDVKSMDDQNPVGGATILDERNSGFAPGLRVFDITWFSDHVSFKPRPWTLSFQVDEICHSVESSASTRPDSKSDNLSHPYPPYSNRYDPFTLG